MSKKAFSIRVFLLLAGSIVLPLVAGAGTFRVATYNVENYLDQATARRSQVKSDAAKAKIRESIRAMNPDVLALEEMGIAGHDQRNDIKDTGPCDRSRQR